MDLVQHVAHLSVQLVRGVAVVIHSCHTLPMPLESKLIVWQVVFQCSCQAMTLKSHHKAHLCRCKENGVACKGIGTAGSELDVSGQRRATLACKARKSPASGLQLVHGAPCGRPSTGRTCTCLWLLLSNCIAAGNDSGKICQRFKRT